MILCLRRKRGYYCYYCRVKKMLIRSEDEVAKGKSKYRIFRLVKQVGFNV